jgi:hypothetical protein
MKFESSDSPLREPVSDSMQADEYDAATMLTSDECARYADCGAYPRSQVAQMYSGFCAGASAAYGTPASQHCFTLRRILVRPTCHATAAHILRRTFRLTCVQVVS